jgi:pyruvate ferredoxin oxidoreductase delta subunit
MGITPTTEAIMKVGALPLGLVAQPGSSVIFKTGDWRSALPVLDREKCSYCGFCHIYCPDGVYQDVGEET